MVGRGVVAEVSKPQLLPPCLMGKKAAAPQASGRRDTAANGASVGHLIEKNQNAIVMPRKKAMRRDVLCKQMETLFKFYDSEAAFFFSVLNTK